MSNNCSQICTPDILAAFMNFLENGEFDVMLSSTLRRCYYQMLLSQELNTTNDTNDSVICNHVGGEDTEANDEICVRVLDKFVWGDEYAQDEKQMLYSIYL
ncbi:Uncharacterized protein FWK35_00031833 [Aphis craccivora]|uniref:Uncharacterized protein n=1 Tax=Aphis craccivora TaxID=307492 RepID=A0A6G0VUG6_APHCR|nr:Uncharacterized protein FWK35_00031833 [Aphis craccivora]